MNRVANRRREARPRGVMPKRHAGAVSTVVCPLPLPGLPCVRCQRTKTQMQDAGNQARLEKTPPTLPHSPLSLPLRAFVAHLIVALYTLPCRARGAMPPHSRAPHASRSVAWLPVGALFSRGAGSFTGPCDYLREAQAEAEAVCRQRTLEVPALGQPLPSRPPQSHATQLQLQSTIARCVEIHAAQAHACGDQPVVADAKLLKHVCSRRAAAEVQGGEERAT